VCEGSLGTPQPERGSYARRGRAGWCEHLHRLDVRFSHLAEGCPWPEGHGQLRIRPIDVARSAATTLSAGPAMPLGRRAARTTAVALEVLSHLRVDRSGDGLRAVGLEALDATARAEVVHRIGVGLARLVAERGPSRLVDFYNLDALASDPSAPVVVRGETRRQRRPDFVGSDTHASWSLVEAKGRTERGELLRTRHAALQQARSVDLEDRQGRPIEPVIRLSCVSRLAKGEVTVFADDPPSGERRAVYRIDPEELIYLYYTLAREISASVGGAERAPGLSGAPSFRAVALLGEDLILGIHRRVLEALDDSQALVEARAALRDDFEADQRAAEEDEDVALSIGPDGLALASRGAALEPVLYNLS
jgi:hypothetical protein